jgi:hypothetical protein
MSNKTNKYRHIPVVKNSGRGKNKTKYCVDIEGGNCCENARVIGYPCHKGSNQKFYHNKTTRQLIAKSSDKCLERNKTGIVQRKCKSYKKTQKWTKRQINKIHKKLPIVISK